MALLDRYETVAIVTPRCIRVRDRKTGSSLLLHTGPLKAGTIRLLEQSGQLLEKEDVRGTLYILTPDRPEVFAALLETSVTGQPPPASTMIFQRVVPSAIAGTRIFSTSGHEGAGSGTPVPAVSPNEFAIDDVGACTRMFETGTVPAAGPTAMTPRNSAETDQSWICANALYPNSPLAMAATASAGTDCRLRATGFFSEPAQEPWPATIHPAAQTGLLPRAVPNPVRVAPPEPDSAPLPPVRPRPTYAAFVVALVAGALAGAALAFIIVLFIR